MSRNYHFDCISGCRSVQCHSVGSSIIFHKQNFGVGGRRLRHASSPRVFRACVLDFPWENA
jgi:hypothetical protein